MNEPLNYHCWTNHKKVSQTNSKLERPPLSSVPALTVKILTNVNNKDGTPIIFSTNIFETEKTPRSFVAECRNKVETSHQLDVGAIRRANGRH